MCGFACGITTTVVGAVIAVVVSIVGYAVVPGIIDNIIVNEMVLINDTIQFERFEAPPFPLNFTVRIWSISNPQEVLQGGVPVMEEVGPFLYRMYQTREISKIEDDRLTYRIRLNYEFDSVASFPNTEEDMVTIVNVPYHVSNTRCSDYMPALYLVRLTSPYLFLRKGLTNSSQDTVWEVLGLGYRQDTFRKTMLGKIQAILQVADQMFPQLMGVLSLALSGIFGNYNSPIITVKVRDLLFDGIRICDNPGLIGAVACSQVRSLSADAQNLAEQEDGSLLFSLLAYRSGTPSGEYVVHRGIEDPADLARIISFEGLPHLLYWVDGDGAGGRGSGVCNMLNGTDSAIFAPFVVRDQSLFALNTDICRSVELRYQYDLEYEGIPAVRYSANEWFLANEEGCFCLNVTAGINQNNGCLLEGAMEIYTCVGAYLVLTYPHFLYADDKYRLGVIGMNPVEEDHRIFLDLEPNTGTIVRGLKRAQFNVFSRAITSIPATQNLRTTLMPIVWVEEGMSLPEEFVDEINSKLLTPLNLVAVLLPVFIAFGALVLLVGIVIIVKNKRRENSSIPATSSPIKTSEIKTA